MKKSFISLLAVILLFGMIPPSGVDASSHNKERKDLQEIHFDNMEEYNESLENGSLSELIPIDEDDVSQYALPAIPVFVGGILVSYMIEGILINNTGFGGGQWVSISIDAFKCWNKGGVVNK